MQPNWDVWRVSEDFTDLQSPKAFDEENISLFQEKEIPLENSI